MKNQAHEFTVDPSKQADRPTQAPQATTLVAAAQHFGRHGSPRILILGFLLVATSRITVSPIFGWHIADALAVACVVGLIPLVEWIVHKLILHSKPRDFGSHRVDLGAGHRDHHLNPNDTTMALLRVPEAAVFLIMNIAMASTIVAVVATIIGGPRLGPMLTGSVTACAGLLHYEWSHYIFHSKYQPRTRYYARLKRNHRLHHWRNENYWLGITSNLGDRVFHTLPADKSDVPMSPTTKTLGIDQAMPSKQT